MRDREVRYEDDYRDGMELMIVLDDQGDVYVSVLPVGHKIGPTVRLCASGGAAEMAPGLLSAMRAAFKAIAEGRAATGDAAPPPSEHAGTMTREQGIARCVEVANSNPHETPEDCDAELAASILQRGPVTAWGRAVLAEARRLVDSGACPALADEKALK